MIMNRYNLPTKRSVFYLVTVRCNFRNIHRRSSSINSSRSSTVKMVKNVYMCQESFDLSTCRS
jgi:hypothetical protein